MERDLKKIGAEGRQWNEKKENFQSASSMRREYLGFL
jgi:hypothetical protein